MKKNGFALIELIVVIAIIGTLLGIAAISGSAWLNRSRVETQMKELYANLLNARVSAMQTSRMYFVDFPTGIGSITQYVIYEDKNTATPLVEGNGTLETATDRIVTQKNLNSRYAMTTSGSSPITFDTRGLVTTGLTGAVANIRVISQFNAAYDCIEISVTRTRMGAWNGTVCLTQ